MSERSPMPIAMSEIVEGVLQADSLVLSALVPAVSEAGASIEVFRALRVLLENPDGVPVGDLGRAIVTSPAATTRVVDRLVTEGLAYRLPDALDRRKILVAVTDAGRGLWTDIIGRIHAD